MIKDIIMRENKKVSALPISYIVWRSHLSAFHTLGNRWQTVNQKRTAGSGIAFLNRENTIYHETLGAFGGVRDCG
jgi:hypothetical protein